MTRRKRRRLIRFASVSRVRRLLSESEFVACRWEEHSPCVGWQTAPISVSGARGSSRALLSPRCCASSPSVSGMRVWVSLTSWRWQHLQEQPAHALHVSEGVLWAQSQPPAQQQQFRTAAELPIWLTFWGSIGNTWKGGLPVHAFWVKHGEICQSIKISWFCLVDFEKPQIFHCLK